MFSDCMTWEQFAEKCINNAKFRQLLTPSDVAVVPEQVHVNGGTLRFLEHYTEVDVVTEDWLKKKCGVATRNKPPAVFQKLTTINVPVINEDTPNGIPHVAFEPRYVFARDECVDGVSKGRLVTRQFVQHQGQCFNGQAKFPGMGEAMYKKLSDDLNDMTHMNVVDAKAPLLSVHEFLGSNGTPVKQGHSLPFRHASGESFELSPDDVNESPAFDRRPPIRWSDTGEPCDSRYHPGDGGAEVDVDEHDSKDGSVMGGDGDDELPEDATTVASGDEEDDEAMPGKIDC